MSIRALLPSLLLTMNFLLPSVALAQSDSARAAAAERYLAVVPMQKMLDDMVTELSAQVPADGRAAFIAEVKALLNAQRLEQIGREALVRVFTAEELNALADFYGSAAGQGVLGKFGAYMGMIMPAIEQEIRGALERKQSQAR